MVMEFMGGGSLADILRRRQAALPEGCLSFVARQVVDALVYVHKDLHVIHSDVKPSNILVGDGGVVKLTDFGVSGQLASTVGTCASWLGTVTYMSPERIQGHSYTVLSDVWSLGLTLVELALGHYPYSLRPGWSASSVRCRVRCWRVCICVDGTGVCRRDGRRYCAGNMSVDVNAAALLSGGVNEDETST